MKNHISIIILILLTFLGQFTNGQTIRYVKPAATGLGDGSSWGNASNDLQLMINNSGVTDQVWVAAGMYKPTRAPNQSSITLNNPYNTFFLKDGVLLYGGFAGTETELGARNYTGNITTLSGDFNDDDQITGSGVSLSITNTGENAYNVVMSLSNSAATLLDGFTIQGGEASRVASGGGGMMIHYTSHVEVRNCVFIHNSAYAGGGMIITNSSTSKITNCRFIENMDTGLGGAGLCVQNSSAPLINRCSFIGNKSTGGGLQINDPALPTVANCLFYDNYALYVGAAIRNKGNNGAIVLNSTFWQNSNNSIYDDQSGTKFINCIFWDPGGIVGITGSPSITYSDVKGGYAGLSNISSDPLFVDAAGGDFRLQSGSPCINVGDNRAYDPVLLGKRDLGALARIRDVTIDMGAFEVQQGDNPLPVVFGAIGASCQNGLLMVNWTATSETNSDYYMVEASGNGKDFTPISQKIFSKAKNGAPATDQQYNFSARLNALPALSFLALLLSVGFKRRYRTLALVVVAIGLGLFAISCQKSARELVRNESQQLFIRIQQVDKDGAAAYSKVVQVVRQ